MVWVNIMQKYTHKKMKYESETNRIWKKYNIHAEGSEAGNIFEKYSKGTKIYYLAFKLYTGAFILYTGASKSGGCGPGIVSVTNPPF